jgi:hypothetical protein
LAIAGEPPIPPQVPAQDGSEVGDRTKDMGILGAPKEYLTPQIGQGKGLFFLFAGICADLHFGFTICYDRLWRFLEHIPNTKRRNQTL